MINSVLGINRKLQNDPEQFVENVEKRYSDLIGKVADMIVSDKDNRIVMLAGPSGSGKTTTARLLRDKLKSMGVDTETISLDNFYLGPEATPKLENGEPDFESVHSLDLESMHRCFLELIQHGESTMPIFDFMVAARSKRSLNVHLKEGGVAIVEGLHALNPMIVDTLPEKNLFKLFVSVGLPIVDERGEVAFSSRQLRLMRRMSRDYIYRNSSAENTLKMWSGVIHGEEKYLCPFSNTADFHINSLHPYEPAVFRDTIIKLLSELPESTQNYCFAKQVMDVIPQFVSLNFSYVPPSSLLREFIKGGLYEQEC